MENFIYQYYIQPIIEKEGYNPVNTATYALIAIIALYVIFTAFKKFKISIDRKFFYSVLAFVLLGSTVRVVTDSIDKGVFKPISPLHEFVLNSHIYDYGFISSSPGIYIVIAALLFIAMGVLHVLKKPGYLGHVGIALWIPHFLVLLPFMKYIGDAIPVLVLAAIPAYVAHKYFKNEFYTLMVLGHALDGAATFWVIDVFGPAHGIKYFEQHVIGSFIGEYFHTFFAFYLLKVAISVAVAYVLTKEKEEENMKVFIALAIAIMGFAPGIRDMLRMIVGA
jgi:uncharacterized membrane protein